MYYGGNVLFKTTNAGQSWDVISPDLTTNDKSKQKSSGGAIVTDNTAAEFHCTILTIAPSPLDANVLWVGTDDGNVQVTRDGGKSWTNVNKGLTGLAPNAWISAIDASRVDAGTAYLSASHWQTNNDYAPYLYKTSDFGRTWTRITNGLNPKGWSHVIREDPKNANLLYAGTENGLYASWDGGGRWVSIRNGMPPAPVRDIKIHPRDNDVIVATHGRGIYILDDASPLQQLGAAAKADTFLFDVRPAIRWTIWNNDADLGDREYQADNPPVGATIAYRLATKPSAPVALTIVDATGQLVRTIRNAPAEAGVNRVVWDLREENPAAPRRPAGPDPIPASVAARFGLGNFGPFVVPGDYTVKLKVGAGETTKPVKVLLDPRVQVTPAELTTQHDTHLQTLRLAARVNDIVDRTDDAIAQIKALQELLTTSTAASAQVAAPLRGQVKEALETLETFRNQRLVRPLAGLGYRQYPRLRDEVQTIASGLGRGYRAPNAGEKTAIAELTAEVGDAATILNALLTRDVARINQATASLPRIVVDPVK